MGHPKIEDPSGSGGRSPKAEKPADNLKPERVECGQHGMRLLTTEDVAVALKVSVRTVERMLHDGEITPVRLRGWLVRFRLEDVLGALRNRNRKWGRKAALTGNPNAETRNPKEAA
jgi:excisionase family DNA binding protein